MNATQVQSGYQPVHQEATAEKTMVRGTLMESIGAIATVILAIAGLAAGFSPTLAAIATIVLGASIWVEGGAFAVRHRRALSGEGALERSLEWSEALGAEFLGGLCGVVLGILALLGVAPMTLLSVATLVFGATFLFGGSTTINQSVSNSQPMFALSAVVLGILAVCGVTSLTLVLVALICLGTSMLFNSAAVGARLALASRK